MTREAEIRKSMVDEGFVASIHYLVGRGILDDIITALDMNKDDIFDMATKEKMKELGASSETAVVEEVQSEPAVVEAPPVEEAGRNEDAEQVENTNPEEDIGDENNEVEDPTSDEAGDEEEEVVRPTRPTSSQTRRERPQRMTASAAWDMFEDVLDAIAGISVGGAPITAPAVADNSGIIEAIHGLTNAIESMQQHITVLTERVEALEGELTGIEVNGLSGMSDGIDSIGKQLDLVEAVIRTDVNLLKGFIQDAGKNREDVAAILEFLGKIGPAGEHALIKNDMMRQLITAASGNFQAMKKEGV